MTTTYLCQLPTLMLIQYMQMRIYEYFGLFTKRSGVQSIRKGYSSWLQQEFWFWEVWKLPITC